MSDNTKQVITRTVTLSDLTPFEIASVFAQYDSEQQAKFFSCLAEEVKDWPGTGWCMQSAYIADDITQEAREVITKLAEWCGDKP